LGFNKIVIKKRCLRGQTPFFLYYLLESISAMKELREEISSILKDTLLSEEFPPSVSAPAPKVRMKPKAVRFNGGTESEYVITFSERGFLVDDTRLSFEEIENALSKEYTMTLKGGTILDAVKMQQILKYKDTF
jgi:hypothetical protein